MPQINLLAWREQALKVKQTRFIAIAVSVIIFAIILIIGCHIYYSSSLSRQLGRNQYLQTQLGEEQKLLDVLKAKKIDLLKIDANLKFLMNLRQQSYQAVQLLEAVTRATPDGITLNKMLREEKSITINAKAASHMDISTFMERLGKMKIFNQPVLSVITEKESPTGNDIIFEVKVEQTDAMTK
jgi:Tfp pilus assembly protein PilN